jgi:hypothetical protein
MLSSKTNLRNEAVERSDVVFARLSRRNERPRLEDPGTPYSPAPTFAHIGLHRTERDYGRLRTFIGARSLRTVGLGDLLDFAATLTSSAATPRRTLSASFEVGCCGSTSGRLSPTDGQRSESARRVPFRAATRPGLLDRRTRDSPYLRTRMILACFRTGASDAQAGDERSSVFAGLLLSLSRLFWFFARA